MTEEHKKENKQFRPKKKTDKTWKSRPKRQTNRPDRPQNNHKKTDSSKGRGVGTIRVDSQAYGEATLADGRQIAIDPSRLNTALDGDRVEVNIFSRKGRQPVINGEVARVISRKRTSFVGVIQEEYVNGSPAKISAEQKLRRAKDSIIYFVKTDERRMYTDIIVLPKDKNKAKNGQKVLVEITKWDDAKKEPLGKITEVLGWPGENETEMKSISLEKGFAAAFSEQVEKDAQEAKKLFEQSIKKEAARRRDFRNTTTFTIDPADAKDFDDALSIKKLSPDLYEVGIHIADVSYFVQPGTALDEEARQRATSVYLVDRTIPMLPEILSNDICSLNEKVDRLTYSAVFEITTDGEIKNEWFGRTIIHSDKRFAYEEAQAILDQGRGQWHDELAALNKIAKSLSRKKMAGGAISFNDKEVKFELDNQFRPVSVYVKERLDTHLLVEDFMLLANRRVAEFVSKINRNQKGTFVYRIHEAPDMEKIRSLAEFISPLGYKLKVTGEHIHQGGINELLRQAIGQTEEHMIQKATVRAMSKAVYSMQNVGHYGLAFPHYTHFTSPIRRYPDLMVHRLLDIYLAKKKPSLEILNEYADLALHCSAREKEAAEAERESIKYKQAEYMESHIGETYQGIISGVTEWGIFVEEIETKAEGLIRLRDMKDDYYMMDERKFCLIGEKTKNKYCLGDTVAMRVVRADRLSRTIDYQLI